MRVQGFLMWQGQGVKRAAGNHLEGGHSKIRTFKPLIARNMWEWEEGEVGMCRQRAGVLQLSPALKTEYGKKRWNLRGTNSGKLHPTRVAKQYAVAGSDCGRSAAEILHALASDARVNRCE